MYLAGQAHFLEVEKIIFQGKSEYQNMMVFQVNDINLQEYNSIQNIIHCFFYIIYCFVVTVIIIWHGFCS